MMSYDTKSSKVSRESNIAKFYTKDLNHAFIPKPNFEECRRVHYADFQEEENKAERYCWEYIARNLKD